MRSRLNPLYGSGLFARAFRGAGWTALAFGLSQVLRLAANLVLTRLLFPEAFGLMALVMVMMIGLTMFSDIGLGPSIMQNKRGDEPDFLNTAWTIQAIRGVLLFLATCALASPVATFYREPMLAQLLPVAGATFIIAGFNTTRIETANRHLLLGRIALLDLVSQAVGIAAMIAAAWWLRSVWALVIGGLIGAATKLALCHLYLPGQSNFFQWNSRAAHELVSFGKWIFAGTVAGFLVNQADKVILGKYLSLELMGILNIGSFLANFPLALAGAITARILIPLYRDRPPAASADNFRKMRFVRFALSGSVLSLTMALAFSGTHLIDFLYDSRYTAAGAIVVLIASIQIPQQVISLTYDQAALAAGDSRRFFYVLAVKAFTQTGAILIGAELGGLVGALVSLSLAIFLLYPTIVWLARLHGVWDPLHDAVCGGICAVLGALALWLNWDAIAKLAALASAPS
jgi:O-antigen/teichoic acid export membrane protein